MCHSKPNIRPNEIIFKYFLQNSREFWRWTFVIFLQFAVYVLVLSYVFSEVFSKFVPIDQSPRRPTFHKVLTDVSDENDSDEVHSGVLPTASLQDDGIENDSNQNSFLLRLKRRSSNCVLRKRIKWNHCLGRRFPEIHCRRLSVTCLSRDNIPPKCKKDMKIIFGERGSCPVITGCTCAAWRHDASWFRVMITDVMFAKNFVKLMFLNKLKEISIGAAGGNLHLLDSLNDLWIVSNVDSYSLVLIVRGLNWFPDSDQEQN